MTQILNAADLAFFAAQISVGYNPVSAGIADPLTTAGLRSLDAQYNNLANTFIIDQYGNFVSTNTFNLNNEPFVRMLTTAAPVDGLNPFGALDYSAVNPSFNVFNGANPQTGGLSSVTSNWAPVFGGDAAQNAQSMVVDAEPRIISNLIADQSANNPAAQFANTDGNPGNAAMDVLPYNSWFVFFGQFFDHGLDFISKGGNGTAFIPLLPNDPLLTQELAPGVPAPAAPFMVLNRATLDANGLTTNSTAPLIEQSQTYGSAETTTFYLKQYDANGNPTGYLLDGASGGMANWGEVKANAQVWAIARAVEAGIDPANVAQMLTDEAIPNIPNYHTWNPAFDNGDGTFGAFDPTFDPGNPSVLTGQMFLADIAHTADPAGKVADADAVINAPGTLAAGEYDNELLDAHLIAGDPRANENIALSAVHDVFHTEHNRLVDVVKDWVSQQDALSPGFRLAWEAAGSANGLDPYFEAAKIGNEMQYQHMVFEEFARRMSPNIDAFRAYNIELNPNITMEFSQAVYRLGHSQLSDTVALNNVAGQLTEMSLVEAFLNPVKFSETTVADIVSGAQSIQGYATDEFVIDGLRNFLVGLPLDLAALNIARGRDVGLPTLNETRQELFAQTNNASLAPYTSWADFGDHLLNPASLINFVAAYATDATITAARNAGDIDGARAAAELAMADAAFMGQSGDQGFWNIDLWIGGLAEQKVVGNAVSPGMLGSTFDFIFASQMLSLQNADRLYYLARIGGNLLAQIEGQTFTDMMIRATGANNLGGDSFGAYDVVHQMATGQADFIKSPAEMLEKINEIIVGNGENNVIYSGDGVDTIRGLAGDDELHGGASKDHIYGGDGNDFIVDEGGITNFLRGDAGNDTILAGTGDDQIFGGTGDDFIEGGAGFDTILGGQGDDTIFGGLQDDALEGDEGDDVLFGGDGDDALVGGAGNDILDGGNGADTYVGDTGSDFFVASRGADVYDGGLGEWDVVSYEYYGNVPINPGYLVAPSNTEAAGAADPANNFRGLNIDAAGGVQLGMAAGHTYIDIEEIRGTRYDDIMSGAPVNGAAGLTTGVALFGLGGDDVLDGSRVDDVLSGGVGSDVIRGRAGVDTAVFEGNRADYTIQMITPTDDGLGDVGQTIIIHNATGDTDTLLSMEFAQFDDIIVKLDALVATSLRNELPYLSLTNATDRVAGVGFLGENGLGTAGTAIFDGAETSTFMNGATILDGTVLSGSGIAVTGLELLPRNERIANNGIVTYTLSGPDAAFFSIAVNALTQVRTLNLVPQGGGATSSEVNYEVKPYYEVTITASDLVGATAFNLRVDVTDVNDNAPVITSADMQSVQVGTSASTIVYQASAIDLDTVHDLGGNNPFAYSIVGGADAGLFNITANGDVTFTGTAGSTPDSGNDGIYDLTIQASDGTNTATKDIHIKVVNAPAANVITGDGADNILEGTASADQIEGLGGNDKLYGLGGDDILLGGGGNDRLYGGLGMDSMSGGTGNDNYYVDNIGDMVFEVAAEGVDTIWASSDFTLADNQEVEYLAATGGTPGFANHTLTGNNLNNRIYGSIGTDTLFGAGGNDLLEGREGVDLMYGGLGDDIFIVDSLNDQVFETAGQGTDYVWARSSYNLTVGSSIEKIFVYNPTDGLAISGNENNDYIVGGVGNDTLSGLGGADNLFGQSGNDVLFGGAGNDYLLGGADNDRLIGGEGVDALFGQSGNDTFVLQPLAAHWDNIRDFVAADDQVEISAADFGGGLTAGTLTGLQFISNADGLAATGGDATTRFIYNTTNSGLYYDSDGTGGTAEVLIAVFTAPVGAPTIADFLVV